MRNIFWIFPFFGFAMSAASYAPSGPSMKIVALGDSTTAGTPGDPESQYAYWVMQRHPEWEIINQGIAGERSDQIFSRFDEDVLRLKPDAVIVMAGVNDLFQGLGIDKIQNNLAQIYERARRAGIRVLACTVLPYNSSPSEVKQKMKDLNEWIHVYSLKAEIGFCDTYSAAEDPANPGRLISSPDGLHPSKEGYRQMGEAITNCLESSLKLLEG